MRGSGRLAWVVLGVLALTPAGGNVRWSQLEDAAGLLERSTESGTVNANDGAAARAAIQGQVEVPVEMSSEETQRPGELAPLQRQKSSVLLDRKVYQEAAKSAHTDADGAGVELANKDWSSFKRCVRSPALELALTCPVSSAARPHDRYACVPVRELAAAARSVC